jgi:hypothetical protein
MFVSPEATAAATLSPGVAKLPVQYTFVSMAMRTLRRVAIGWKPVLNLKGYSLLAVVRSLMEPTGFEVE